MKVTVQSVNFNADQKLINFVEQKLNKLENRFDKIIYADVFLKLENTNEPENKITEILISVPGNELVVKKTNKKFEEGVDEGVNTLLRQLQKRKEKIRAYA
ncbi:ribosome hibernation-promoting factor, HPF/YfiA family [Mesonia maritima]|uniref:Sigma-54 modulation protein n=1 Tax=Mesonia maritima TaxID=1793873 RepID=A0ABU1K7E4_9FLAO|nr:ribosome-associated translation inhibitor RaiA [Mesonia maritima]MDR6301180.1 putative sigma-54 modulation protein [Mesonia maritima]